MLTLYDTDFDSWINEQVILLKEQAFHAIDVKNIIEEIEGMSKSDRRALCNQMIRLLIHLLKFKYQPEKQVEGSSWASTIRDSKREIESILEDSPSLKNYLVVNFKGLYLKAIREASAETGIPINMFENECPWSLNHILGE